LPDPVAVRCNSGVVVLDDGLSAEWLADDDQSGLGVVLEGVRDRSASSDDVP